MKLIFQIVFIVHTCIALAQTASTAAAVTPVSMDQMQLDSYCPRIEGKTLKQCCPAKFIKKLKCTYQIVTQDQRTKNDSAVTVGCEDKDGQPGEESPIKVACCGEGSKIQCGDPGQTIKLDYYTRLIYRNNSCTESKCPEGAPYWQNPPALDPAVKANASRFTKLHKLSDISECTADPIDQCTAGLPACETLHAVSCRNKTCQELGNCPKTCQELGNCPKTCQELGNCPPTCQELGNCPPSPPSPPNPPSPPSPPNPPPPLPPAGG
ncbi:MAG: hypothetical protein WA160_16825 [Pseudobdellovibrio sp.]